jgi:succinoglycan biosynthesis protein ExoA
VTRRVSLVAPMLNEARHVEQLAADLAAQDVEAELELVVADGGSDDGCRELLRAAAERHGLGLTLVDNPKRWAGPGLNRALRHATGEIVVRLDCHTRYPPEYVRRCLETLESTGAWNVGGCFTAVGETPTERAIACAYDSPFGGISWTRHRASAGPIESDIVYYGAFPRWVFERVGLYDEQLGTAELEDLCQRIRDAGGTVVHDPALSLLYRPRSTFAGLARQYYRYGLWKVAATRKHGRPLSGRSVVPLVFVGSLAALGLSAPASRRARGVLGAELCGYGLAAACFAAVAVRGRQESWRLTPRVALAFAVCHTMHGAGQVHGWIRAARRRGRSWPAEPRLRPTMPSETGSLALRDYSK